MADSQFFIKQSTSCLPEIKLNVIYDSRNKKKNFRLPGWNMIADIGSYAFYASHLCELSDQLKKEGFSAHSLLTAPPPYMMPNTMQSN